jgi:hypothetical protein
MVNIDRSAPDSRAIRATHHHGGVERDQIS